MRSLFEEMGGSYRRVGDYFVPNVHLEETSAYQLGKYGRMRKRYFGKDVLLLAAAAV